MCVCARPLLLIIFFSFLFASQEPVGMFYMGRCSIYTPSPLNSNWNSSLEVERREIILYPISPSFSIASSQVSLLLSYYHYYHNFEKYTIFNCLSKLFPPPLTFFLILFKNTKKK
jgi:hypothetical protein